MRKERAIKILSDRNLLEQFLNERVFFKGDFIRPRGGYIISDEDKRFTSWALEKLAKSNT